MSKSGSEVSTLSPEEVRAIVLFDIDGTILRKEGPNNRWENESWFLLTAGFNASIDAHKEIYGRYRDNITHDPEKDLDLHNQMVKELIDLWEQSWGGKITREDMTAACQMIENQVSADFKTAAKELMANKILVLIGTGAFELAAEAIAGSLNLELQMSEEADEYHLKYWFGNTSFNFDDDGVLVSFDHDKDIPARKADQALKKFHDIFKILSRAVPTYAVGDGISDFVLFSHVFGIAFNAKDTDQDFKLSAKAIANDWHDVVSTILLDLSKIEREDKDGV